MRFEKCLMTNDFNDSRKMEPDSAERWGQAGRKYKKENFPSCKITREQERSRGGQKNSVVGRNGHAGGQKKIARWTRLKIMRGTGKIRGDRSGCESGKNEDVCVVAMRSREDRC